MKYKQILSQLTAVGPRCAEKEIVTAKLIEDYLTSNRVAFMTQPFVSKVPVIRKAELIVDGESIDCLGSSIVSGEIPNGEYLISHFGYSGETP